MMLVGLLCAMTTLGTPTVERFFGGAQGAFSMEFDDSMDSQVKNLLPLLARHQAVATYATALAKARLQLRLLRVHAQIIRYRWNTGALPANLDQCCSTDSRIDPFTREPLHFEPIEGGYRLYSLGVPDVGKVELKYKSNGAGAKGAEPPSGDPR